ncbi:class I SAM-dependent methyltransferase [Variovorax sp. J22P271]|uniref:class I SAM-dependent methyltransferase n=1 Tax=Variovorax davisae TaxID=3053515 RepID=UPI0025766683|nr:class I SAM-dependent methyltransferase [Variovorax sp. J22P271]MDM0033307.1 class I SAM-dependent methyltransferase [Variovorax sp. J22P271]
MEKTKVDFDAYTENYNDLLRDQTSFFSSNDQYFAEYKVRAVRSKLKREPKRILEYGCGIGRNVRYLAAEFPFAEIVGTDISHESIDLARSENSHARFEVESSSLELGEFDLVFVAGVFHHIPPSQRAESVQTILNRMRKGGEVFIFEHNPYNPVTRRIVNNCPYDADAVLLRPAELRQRLEAGGFKLLDGSYCLLIPPSLKWLAPIERFFGALPLGGQYWVSAEKCDN